MRKNLVGGVLALAFAIGVVSGMATPSRADGKCYAYCDSNDQVVMCCPYGCWQTGQPCNW